ncbi:phosphatidylserine decarboxylase [Alysiella crassa]|uniref:Phosphatidylserine decarboxylase proenzyme n=2 Tax=Alysiella crassa TaxID=153491 RepID=A0A376BLU3_9NEIS|nr:phosphatidylserine decarboxylase [Alysiella crassa]
MNRYYPHTIIAQEGWSFILGGLAASVFFSFLCGWWSLPFWIFTLFCVNFFRDPARNIPEAPDAVISPADGRIVVVERAIDPYRNTEALKISVFMNVFNVHSQRSPVSGVVTDVQYSAGKFLNAALDKSSNENERNAVLMTTRTGRELTFVQVAGLVARRILCYTNKGDTMVRGERYGFIRFGSRVDVYLPLDATANVAIGDKVRASETILAFLPLEPTEPNKDFHPSSSNSVAETRLKADLQPQPVAATSFQAAPIKAETVAQSTTTPIATASPISLDEARLAAETAKLKAEAEAAKQAAEQARAQAEAEIAQLKAQAEQARAQAEQAKAQAEAEVARLKAEQEAAQLKAQQEAEAKAKAEQEAAQLKAQQEAEAKAKAEQEAAQLKAQQEAEAKAKAEQEAAQLKAQQEAEAKAKAEQEAAQLKAQQEAKAKAEQEAAQLKAQQEAKAKAEKEAQAAAARARAEEVAKAQAAEKAKQEALAKAQAEAEAKLKAEQAAKAKAAQAAKEQARAEQSAKAKAEAEALAEIAARKPIVRREVFAAVPEPWQTIEPREVIIRTEVVDKK